MAPPISPEGATESQTTMRMRGRGSEAVMAGATGGQWISRYSSRSQSVTWARKRASSKRFTVANS